MRQGKRRSVSGFSQFPANLPPLLIKRAPRNDTTSAHLRGWRNHVILPYYVVEHIIRQDKQIRKITQGLMDCAIAWRISIASGGTLAQNDQVLFPILFQWRIPVAFGNRIKTPEMRTRLLETDLSHVHQKWWHLSANSRKPCSLLLSNGGCL